MEKRDDTFIKRVAELAGDEIHACYQCHKCSAGCPVAEFMDYLPAQIIRLCQFGCKDEIFKSKTIWLCASCETCTTRCPNKVDVAKTMDVLRQECLESEYKPVEGNVYLFHRVFLDSIKSYGRIYEAGMIREYKLKSGKLFNDIKLGISMMKKGKIKLSPHKIKDVDDVKKMIR